MRSLEARFQIEVDKKPLHSTFVCFACSVESQRFTRRVIITWFDRLVDIDDYDLPDKKKLIDYLVELSNS